MLKVTHYFYIRNGVLIWMIILKQCMLKKEVNQMNKTLLFNQEMVQKSILKKYTFWLTSTYFSRLYWRKSAKLMATVACLVPFFPRQLPSDARWLELGLSSSHGHFSSTHPQGLWRGGPRPRHSPGDLKQQWHCNISYKTVDAYFNQFSPKYTNSHPTKYFTFMTYSADTHL